MKFIKKINEYFMRGGEYADGTPHGETNVDTTTKTPINPTYNFFAVRNSDNKIVNGWEYSKECDAASRAIYCKNDLSDQFPDEKVSKNYKIYAKNSLIKKGIDPFDSNNWSN